MKKPVVFLTLLLLAKLGSAQYSLAFCENVTDEGKPVRVSNQFQVDAEGGMMKYLVRTDDKFNTDKLDYRIYYMSDGGTEEEVERLTQAVQPDWTFAWKEMVMFDPGMYRVKVYTGSGTYITSANLTVKRR